MLSLNVYHFLRQKREQGLVSYQNPHCVPRFWCPSHRGHEIYMTSSYCESQIDIQYNKAEKC